jgi:acyl transferase domain-containing protein/NADPH:quinone reductase-like Zn-dependent oxidoreductase/acyl carrier protein
MTERAIAIVGASCRFPGADGIEAFWRLLLDRRDAVSEVGPGRWSTRFFGHPVPGTPGKSYSFAAGLIEDTDQFEPEFFGISPREAAAIDPRQRLLLELAWHALEDAGIPASTLAGEAVGVYVGASATDYADLRLGDPSGADAYFLTGASLGILANRISHVLDLRGPSLVIDTACSSSLVALHQACTALSAGEIGAALVGGINLLLSPYPFVGFAQAGMLSRLGRCFAFDARADGYVRGEGGAVIVLKPLAQALARGDVIRAVIRGTGVAASGRTIGLSLPSEAAQADLLRTVYRRADVAGCDVAFVEMHGTGTPAGDPVEAAAVGQVLGQDRAAPLPIGSVKTNIGHLEAASGMAGLLKAMLAFQHGTLPPSLYGETPNPAIPFERLNLRWMRHAQPLVRGPDACIGINSFGFGGTIAHAVVAPPPVVEIDAHLEGGAEADAIMPPLLFSARTEVALRAVATQWRDTLADAPRERLTPMLRAAARRRDHHPHRFAVRGDDFAQALMDFAADTPNPHAVRGTAAAGRLAFVYSGNGAQFTGMGQAVYRSSAVFRAALQAPDAALQRYLGWSVAESIAAGLQADELQQADVAQPALFAIQVALTEALRQAGAKPTGFVGHSVGEIAAAWAAGALSLDEAARVVAVRSRHQEQTRDTGRMAVVALSAAEAATLIADAAVDVELAAVNSSRSVTMSGTASAIAALAETARDRGVACRPLDLPFAFHSHLMDPIRRGLCDELRGIRSAAPATDFVSTVTGGRTGAGALGPDHWWRNIREPVRFTGAVELLVAGGYRIFVEIGPTPVLQSYLRDALSSAQGAGVVLPTLDRGEPDDDRVSAIAARLYVAGHDISGAACFDGRSDPRGLPLYPWQRKRYWFPQTIEAAALVDRVCDHPLLGFRQTNEAGWRNHLDVALFPFLRDHRVDGVPVLPAAAIIELALAAARSHHPDAPALELRDVDLLRPLALPEGETREVHFDFVSPDGDWRLSSRPRLADEPVIVNATGRIVSAIRRAARSADSDPADAAAISPDDLYRRAGRIGLDYGSRFQVIDRVSVSSERSVILALVPTAADEADCLIHPTLLDGALQGMLALVPHMDRDADVQYLPRRFGRVRAVAPYGRTPRRAELKLTERGRRSVVADIALFDETGALVAEMSECCFAAAARRSAVAAAESYLRVDLVPAPLGRLPQPAIVGRIGEILSQVAAAERRKDDQDQALLFEALLAAVAFEAVTGLGDSLAVPPAAAALLEQLLAMLRRFGAATDETGAWRLVVPNVLPDPGELWRSLLAEKPDLAADLALVAGLRELLPALLREGSAPEAASPMRTGLRQACAPIAAARNAMARALETLAREWPTDRSLRLSLPEGSRFAEKLYRAAPALVAARPGQPCDVAICVEADIEALKSASERLVPGGLLLAFAPARHPIGTVMFGETPELPWPPPGFAAGGAVPLALAPWPSELRWATLAVETPAEPDTLAVRLAVRGDATFAEALSAIGCAVCDDLVQSDSVVFAAGNTGHEAAALPMLLPQVAELAAKAAERQVSLWLVTEGSATGSDDGVLTSAVLCGFGRVLRNEVPGLALRVVELPGNMSIAERAVCLAREMATAGPENEVVWTAAGRHVPRLRRGLPPSFAAREEPIVASGNRPGLDGLCWVSAPSRALAADEIEIEVHATGLNFRDVMWTTGALPEEALSGGFAGASLGFECAGVVRAAGDGLHGFAAGDRVAGFAPAAIASRVVTRADALIPIPPGLSFVAAATLPVAFVTAIYAIETLARLQSGESILIHAASGGVGLAAIQIAKRRGATVIATAGSPEKRAFLRMVGADRVCDSRDLAFIGAVRAATGGAGVDVVLNSLHGEAMAASLDLLKPFGRFVELGKRDFYGNRKLRARPLRRNISYFAVDIDRLPVERQALAKTLLMEVSAALASGDIRPLAHRCFTFAELGDAMRLMQAAQHIGKLVLVPDDNAGVVVTRPPQLPVRRDGCYVVTGGADGFGFAAARFLAERGAGHLALIGRRGAATPGAIERMAELEALGATVTVHAADVADEPALTAVLEAMRAQGHPVRGVVHAAAAIVDGLASELTAADVAAAWHAKVGGALLLDRLTRDDPLELFWLFSSATTIVGAPGQGAYVAANHALEALARRRHAEGRPALAVAWGPISDVGRLASRPDEREALARRLGVRPLPAATALAALPAMAASGVPVLAFAEADWNEARRTLPSIAAPFYEEVRDGHVPGAAEDALPDRLAALGAAERRSLIESIVAEEAARILRMNPATLDLRRPLSDLGMDSLMALELRLALEARLRIDLPLVGLSDGTSIAALSMRLADCLNRPQQPIAGRDPVAALAARHEPVLDPPTFDGLDLAADE